MVRALSDECGIGYHWSWRITPYKQRLRPYKRRPMVDKDEVEERTVVPARMRRPGRERFAALPADTAARMDAIAAQEERMGGVPAILPKVLLQSPIWFEPRFASARQAFGTEFMPYSDPRETHIASQANILPRGNGRGQSTGLLRWLDLDVVMALSFAWTQTGDRHVEMRQRDILQLMGYEDLTQAPYEELRGSIRRLGATQIAIFPKGQPTDEVSWWKILDHNERVAIHEKGQPLVIRATLSEGWEMALRGIADWQMVDLRCYAHLVRHARRTGLARLLYLFFASWRKADRSFEVPLQWVAQRFADRHAPASLDTGFGSFRYRNPLSPQSKLGRALKLLSDSGVLEIYDSHGTRESVRLRGSFLQPKGLPTLILPGQGPQQTFFISTSMWDERIADIVPADQLPLLAAPAETPSGKPSSSHESSKDGRSQPGQPASRPQPRAGIASHLPQLLKLVHLSKHLVKEARTAGWQDDGIARVLIAALWKNDQGELRKTPEAWAAAILRTDENWTQKKFYDEFPTSEMASWATGPGGPLGAPLPKRTKTDPVYAQRSGNGDNVTITGQPEASS